MDGATRILVVEDETVVAEYTRVALEGLGYLVAGIAAPGQQALELIGGTSPDLVLMDIVLPGEMDGIETASQIWENFDIPVVYLTTLCDEATIERVKYSQPYGYILKPFGERELRAGIEIALYRHAIVRRLEQNKRLLSAILESICDGVIAVDALGTVKFLNPAAEALTGWRRPEALGRELYDVYSTRQAGTNDSEACPVREVFQGEIHGVPWRRVRLFGNDGSERAIEHSAAPLVDEWGRVMRVALAFREVQEKWLSAPVSTLSKEGSDDLNHEVFRSGPKRHPN